MKDRKPRAIGSTVDITTTTELTDKNLYAYCDNNPVTRVDGDGEFWHVLIGAVVGSGVSFWNLAR